MWPKDELSLDFKKYTDSVDSSHFTRDIGRVTEVIGMLIKGYLPGAALGSVGEIVPLTGDKSVLAEVVGFSDRSVLMMPLGELRGVGLGARIVLKRLSAAVRVGPGMLGRVMDSLGTPLDHLGPIEYQGEVPLYNEVRNPMDRKPIREPLDLGIRAINGFLTVGKGQRVGIMAGSGVGKSVLLGMMAKNSKADVNVIAMIGERGREVREFIEQELGPEGMKRSVVIAVTSDQSPLFRMRGAFVATAIAEHFAARGKQVLLMMDSVTRFAMAQREIGLSVGEPPATKGYTPSVFALLPRLLERAGSFEGQGSVTGLYTVLVEGDDMDDPIGDSVRSIVDGHIVLSRKLAHKAHFPAIDILTSASRVMKAVVPAEQMKIALRLREAMAVYKDAEDLINIGAYKAGANPKIDHAIRIMDNLNDFLKQSTHDSSDMTATIRAMQGLLAQNG
jgi:flagellum-specific ATP synthase